VGDRSEAGSPGRHSVMDSPLRGGHMQVPNPGHEPGLCDQPTPSAAGRIQGTHTPACSSAVGSLAGRC
jgi:hypothetical protein